MTAEINVDRAGETTAEMAADMAGGARLHSEGVSLIYPRTASAVVHDVSLRVPDGLITTIIGPNGCGKSTLLRAMGRLMRPKTGSVTLDGQLIHRLPSKEVARRLGLLQQQARAPEGITVADLARRGRYPHQGFFQPPSRRDLDAVERALTLSGMQDLRDREIDALSGGQRQRAWIAMALAQETDLLLLDEPTTFLDLAHQHEVMSLVTRLNADGRTVVMVLHDINEAAAASHHVVAMKDGRVVREGAPGKILDADLLAELYGVECDVFPHPDSDHPVCFPRSAERDWNELVEDAPDPLVPSGVSVRGLRTGYGRSVTVSEDLNATFPRGAITTIVGPNGCGKSTLLRTGARLLNAQAGSVTIDGIDTTKGSRRALARRLASVMQGPAPPGGFVVEDLVAGGRISHQGFLRQWTRRDAEIVGSAMARCGILDLRYREVDSLSGGQRQRAWIAMALAQDTPYLFLDEPTTFLDIGYQIEVLDLVSRLNRDEGRTVVMVLHDLNMAARYSDHIVVMRNGRIEASGPPSQVINPATIREIFTVDGTVRLDARTGRPLLIPASVAASRAAPQASGLDFAPDPIYSFAMSAAISTPAE